jgi:GNAT superfamily N-acetyltransferase
MQLVPVIEGDFEELAEIRIAAMRESLERVGRFDRVRARTRLLVAFSPEYTRFILVDGERAGFYAARPTDEGVELDHLYILPDFQNRGVGSQVLSLILTQADHQGLAVFVGALKESASNRFYVRHGFVLASKGEWDNYYVRPAPVAGAVSA